MIAIEKAKTRKNRIHRNFGSPNPEGTGKRAPDEAGRKIQPPVICFVDTSGAFCGIGAEERGQGQAIAENLMEMMTLKTPILTILTGEGGSGGALALAVSDEVWMLENAIYSVISPEGCASILWKDADRAPDTRGKPETDGERRLWSRCCRTRRLRTGRRHSKMFEDLTFDIRDWYVEEFHEVRCRADEGAL